MANRDLFKEAIAEAKSIREAAILNAKEALEESLTPHLKSMLAAKLQEMEEAELDEVMHDDMDESVEEDMDEMKHDKDMDEAEITEAEDDSEESEDEAEEEEADVEGEEEGEEAEAEAEEEVEVGDMEVDDLKELIRDLIRQEMEPAEDEMAADMGMDVDMEAGEEAPEDMVAVDGEDEEEIDLAELLAELEALEEGEDEMEEGQGNIDAHEENPHDQLEEDLKEALETINTLKAELSEVNLLNAKLLYVNKVFRNNNLTEDQKVKVIATFDKAETVKEVKLVFETVKENLVSEAKAPARKTVKEHKSFASKATGNAPKPAEVVPMVSEQVLRMQKLAGIIK
jgi:hypothetical protein